MGGGNHGGLRPAVVAAMSRSGRDCFAIHLDPRLLKLVDTFAAGAPFQISRSLRNLEWRLSLWFGLA